MDSSTTSLSSSLLKPRSQVPSSSEYALHGKIMLCTIVLLMVVVIIMVCFHSYEHCCFFKIHHRPRRGRRSRPLWTHQLFSNPSAAASSGGVAPQQGLDVSILKALPTFLYSSKTHDPLLECSVCLSDFQEEEKGRVLPQCHHAFHVPCIDMWFHTHSNCPLCRVPVLQPPDPKPTETVVSVTEPAREKPGLCEQDKGYRDDEKVWPSSSSQEECQQEISTGLVGVTEVPSAVNEGQRPGSLVDMALGSQIQHGL